MMGWMDEAARWRDQLAAWAIPDDFLAAATESPYGFSVDVFSRIADEAVERALDPSGRRAMEVLPAGGDVLDVGCGAGVASLPLAAAAGRLIGVDQSEGLLAAFAQRAERLGVGHAEILGRWPDVAGRVPVADVVVCRHVAYNVPDLDSFLLRLTEHARRRVVVQLTTEHPLAWMSSYWERLHGIARPEGPTVGDAMAVARDAGLAVAIEGWEEPFDLARTDVAGQMAFLRRRLCLGEDRDRALRHAIEELGVPGHRPVATLWWSGSGPDPAR